jgi:curved DNA-binding protein CbpA
MAAKPSTGSLGQTPLCQLLVYLLERKLSGSLVIQHLTGGKSSLTFAAGVPIKVRAGQAQIGFGNVCVALGLLDEAVLEPLLQSPRDLPLGEELQKRGLLDPAKVPLILETQVYLRLEWVAGEPDETIFGFYEGQDFLSTWGGEPRHVDPLRAIWRAATKRGLPTAKVDQVLGRWQTQVARLHPQSRVARFGFTKDVNSALDVLRAKPMSIAELERSGIARPADLRQALAILALCRHLDTGDTPLAVEASSSVMPAASRDEARRRVITASRLPPTSSSGETPSVPGSAVSKPRPTHEPLTEAALAELQAEVANKLDLVLSQDYYKILGISETADLAATQAAFFALAKKWHPDRLAVGARELRGDVTRIFARMTEAHQVLSNAAQRAEYDRLRDIGESSEEEQRDVQRLLRASNIFQKAEASVKRSDWAQAERFAKQAQDLDPEHVEYGALYAWAVAKSGQRAANGNYEDLLEILNRAVKLQKDNPRIRLYRAGVLKAAGQTQEALRDYRAVVEMEPNNVEASRELRLHRMRAENTTQAPGLLSRLFKK